MAQHLKFIKCLKTFKGLEMKNYKRGKVSIWESPINISYTRYTARWVVINKQKHRYGNLYFQLLWYIFQNSLPQDLRKYPYEPALKKCWNVFEALIGTISWSVWHCHAFYKKKKKKLKIYIIRTSWKTFYHLYTCIWNIFYLFSKKENWQIYKIKS